MENNLLRCHCVVADIPFVISAQSGALVSISIDREPPSMPQPDAAAPIPAAIMQLEEYFRRERQTFDLPLATVGTEFQRRVWAALRAIPYGETRTYGQIAAAVGCPGGARAVGMACRRNPWLVVVPCHRAVGADGSLTGFAAGLEMKRRLLALERP